MNSIYANKSRNLSRRKQTAQMPSSDSGIHINVKQNNPPNNRSKEQSSKKHENRPHGSDSLSRYTVAYKYTGQKPSTKGREKRKMTSTISPKMNPFSSVSAFTSPRTSDYPSPPKNIPEKEKDISKEAFRFLQKIGSGGFGQVWKVQFKKNSRPYAMKEISKTKVIIKKSVQSILNEKEILCSLYSPFIVNMKCSFQDRENLYLVLDYLTGGDLRYHLCSKQSFSEEESKFIIACIVLGLEYIHENGIIHRDIKPENLVFENTGYIRITDFGIARKRKEKNSSQTSGTPGYMSPEVICRLNHSFQADYFALGVIAYEFMLRKRPYIGNSRKQIREHILSKQVLVGKYQMPRGWSMESVDFINKLIQRKKQARLGYNGIVEIKKHPWLASINWEKLKNKQIRPPFSPRNLCQTTEYLREIEFSDQTNNTHDEQQRILLRNLEIQELFQSYNQIGAFKMYYNKDSTKSTFYTYCQHQDK